MIAYSIYSEHFDRGWLVQAADEKAAKNKVRKWVLSNWGEAVVSEAKESGDKLSITDIFGEVDIIEGLVR